jgi:hypothetical protein
VLCKRQVDGSPERIELPFTLRGCLFAHVGVAGAEMDVGGVDQSEHDLDEDLA